MRRLALLALLLPLSGCAPLVIGAVGGAGYMAAQDRTLSDQTEDTRIKLAINEAWFKFNERMYQQLESRVHEGRVLVTGTVTDPQWRVDAVRLAWQVNGVREVLNEVQVSDDTGGIETYASDSWIGTQLRAKLLAAEEVRSANYSIDTVKGIVYIMGIARNQSELDIVLNHARSIPGVVRVVSYIRLYNEPTSSEPDSQ